MNDRQPPEPPRRATMATNIAAEPPRADPKEIPYRSAAWIAAVRSIGQCVLCGSTENIQAAHRNEGKGMASKADCCLSAALCQACHSALDQGAGYTNAQRRAEMDRAIVLTLRELSRRGLVGVM